MVGQEVDNSFRTRTRHRHPTHAGPPLILGHRRELHSPAQR